MEACQAEKSEIELCLQHAQSEFMSINEIKSKLDEAFQKISGLEPENLDLRSKLSELELQSQGIHKEFEARIRLAIESTRK